MKSWPLLASVAIALISCGPQPSSDLGRVSPTLAPRSEIAGFAKPPTANPVFTVGSSTTEVAAVMGSADTSREMPDGATIWSYKFSTVTFRNSRVIAWANHGGNLKTRGAGDSRKLEPEKLSRGEETYMVDLPEDADFGRRTGGSQPSGTPNSSLTYIGPYQRSNGTVVPGHYRTRADSSSRNNFSSSGNRNPYTGRRGSR